AFGDGTTTFTRDGSAADLMTAIDNGELRWVAPSDAAFGLLRLTVDDGDADATADVTLEVDAPPEPPPSKPGAPSRPGTPSTPGSPRAPEQPSVVKPQPQSLAAPPPWHDPIGETTPRPESTSSAVAPPDASPPLGTARVADAAPAPATTPERDARGMRWGALAMLAMGGGIVLLLVRRRRDDERRAPQL
ncbi:MAG TPA: hypothetical protein VF183_06315, partial [Acidimicrobiales bacterium]